ncbi:glycoside hydrolase family 5 protein [Parapedobacter sp. SGR-10]|uniref:glycoside hydrolase family 5 protein n=1 Tax=Parapedobacter sp. SGR-10 TaxID=2710879 RepID=UPI0013D5E94C|nr:cellulase family glycosylhydrolase [Parapedobacter sp. SGR-10]NGF57703.1 glycoside hydrolase family 5 protein [Parapedobacter sp. SGR-10]
MKMKFNMGYFVLLISIAVVFLAPSCEKEKKTDTVTERIDPVLSVMATLDGSEEKFYAEGSTLKSKDILINFPSYFPQESDEKIDLSKVKLDIVFNEGIKVVTAIPALVNLENPFVVKIQNVDGNTEEISIRANIQKDTENFRISKGINIASWLSTPKYTGTARTAFFTEADVKLLSELGFDHIRLCIDEVVLWNESGNKIRSYGFDLLHDAIKWCDKYDMGVIVDMHVTRNHRFTNTENTLFTDPAQEAKFVELWEDLSDELKDYPNSLVAYELLNEPVSAGGAANWNRVSASAINAIRAKEANRVIIVGVCTVNGSVRYNDLTLPSTHRIIATFHYYGPFLLTYYGFSSTTGGRTDIPIHYPTPTPEHAQLVPEEWISALPANWQSTGRNTYDKTEQIRRMQSGLDIADRLGVPLYVGEFGTANLTPEPARSNWYKDIVAILKERNIAYASFDYKGAGYSVVNEDANRTLRYPGIIDIILDK